MFYQRLQELINKAVSIREICSILSKHKRMSFLVISNIFFSNAGPLSHRLWPLLRTEVVTILLRGHLIGGHRYPLWRDGQFYIHALSGSPIHYTSWSAVKLHLNSTLIYIGTILTKNIRCVKILKIPSISTFVKTFMQIVLNLYKLNFFKY